MRRSLLFAFIMLMTCAGWVRAQYDAQFSQYFMAMGYYNPGYAGNSDDLNLFGLYRQQWVGISGAPQSFFVTADMPLKIKNLNNGVGLVVFSESIGLFRNTHFAGQFAHKLKLFGGTLSIGIQAGIASITFDGTKVFIPEGNDEHQQEDEAIPRESVSGTGLDLNAGLYYTHKHFYVGFGATHITEPEMQLTETAYTYIPKGFNFTGGYNIQFRNPLYELQPSVFLKTDLQSFQADVTARLVYNKMFNGGFSWRVNESVVLLLGAKIGRFQVGYAYDFPTTAILKASSGSHELMVKYAFQLKKTKTGKNKHKSVRIL